MAVIGIDVGGTKIYSAIAQDGNVLVFNESMTPSNLEDFTSTIKYMVSTLESNFAGTVSRIGVAIPGVAKSDGRCWVPNLPYLNDLKLGTLLHHTLGKEVLIENDARLALFGEQGFGVARDVDDAILVSIGTGVGGAILMGGEIRRGRHGTAGAFGWLTLDFDSDRPRCEEIVSGTGLNVIARQYAVEPTSFGLLRGVKDGDEQAKQLFGCWARQLGFALAGLVSTFDPEMIILSGGLSEEFDLFYPIVKNAVSENASPMTRDTPILKARLGNKAVLYGAFRLAHEGGL